MSFWGVLFFIGAASLSLLALLSISLLSLLSTLILPYFFENSILIVGVIFGGILMATLSFSSFLFFAAFFIYFIRLIVKAFFQNF